MTKPDYTAFDAELVRMIKAGFNTFKHLQTPGVRDLAQPFVSHRSAADRVIDRRLQALRKAGKIKYRLGVWQIVEQ